MKNPFSFLTKSVDTRYSLYNSVGRHSGDYKLNPTDGLNWNETSLYLNKGIAKRAEKISETEFLIKNIRDEKVNTSHWLNNLLSRPNNYQTGNIFWKLASIYHDTTGFCVIEKITNNSVFTENVIVTELHILNSIGIVINYEKNDQVSRIKSFTYTDPHSGMSREVPFENTIYWVNPNPKNPLEGISILRAGMQSLVADKETSNQQISILKNGGVVDGVFSFKNVLNAEQLSGLKKDYKANHANSDNAGTPLFLGGEATYQRLGLNVNELAYIESKKLLTRDVIAITGVPASVMGITEDQTYANADASIRIFLRETIKPIVAELVNLLDWKLAPKDVTIDFVNPTPEDIDAKILLVRAGHEVNAVTLNEKREMLGLTPVTDGDDVIDQNATPVVKQGILVHPLRNKEFRQVYHANHTKSLASKQRLFKAELKSYFDGQKKRILASVQARKQVKVKTLADELFNVNLEVTLMTPLLATMKEIAIESGQEVMDIFKIDRTFNYSTSIDTAIDKRFKFFATTVNDTTAKDLSKQVAEWYQNNETTKELVERIGLVYDKVADYRLETIANTETSAIKQVATMESYQQMGLKTKIWVWSPGIKGGVRDAHQAIDGEERPIDMAFSNGLMYPLDSSASAGETINCECSV